MSLPPLSFSEDVRRRILQAAIRCAVIRAELFPDRATAACGAIDSPRSPSLLR